MTARIILLFLFSVTFLTAQTKFLMPDEAFKPSASLQNSTTIRVLIEPGEDIYIYKEQVAAKLSESSGIAIKNITMDESVEHHGEQVFLKPLHIQVELEKKVGVSGMKNITLALSFQGCSEKGLCYEPMTKNFTFDVESSKLPVGALASLPLDAEVAEEGTDDEEVISETDRIAQTIKEGNVALVLLSFLGFGLLLSFTPCIFPMIPILSSVIVSQGTGLTTKRAFYLSLVYVLAMSVAYTIAGVLAGLFGSNLQAAFQTTWVIVTFSLVFVALSFSMFGMYELQLPNALQAKLTKVGGGKSGVLGVAIMGFLSALIVGPCVAAPLAGALIYIGQSGDALLGGMALFALSIGMGLPLLLVGTTAGKFMPKPGAWMDSVKAFFGVMLLGVSVWMISRVIPESITMLLWSVLLIFVSVNLGAFEPIGSDCIRCGRANKKAMGILAFLYALMLFVGGFTGGTNPLHPLEKLQTPQSMFVAPAGQTVAVEQSFSVIHSIEELDTILAKSSGKKVLLDFYADWCTSCKELEHNTFADAAVKAKMAEFILVQADVTANTEQEKALTQKFGLFGPPGIIFFDAEGQQIKGRDLVGYIAPDAFLAHLNKL